MNSILTCIFIGLAAGFLGGQFGVGGGLITTPAIRLILQQSALIAVGTPLPVIIPTALSGFYNYYKNKLVDYRSGLIIGLTGALSSILGAWLTRIVGGSVILLITAMLIAIISIRYFRPETAAKKIEQQQLLKGISTVSPALIIIGLISGFASGFLGLGGGFIIIPALTFLIGMEIKKAFGTSLLSIIFIAIPGAITHYFLGNVDLQITLLLVIGVIPGAFLGSKVTINLPDKVVRVLFGLYLLLNALFLAGNEIFLIN